MRVVKTVYKCLICLDTGWEGCSVPWCADDDHGTYCRCDIGIERQLEEAG